MIVCLRWVDVVKEKPPYGSRPYVPAGVGLHARQHTSRAPYGGSGSWLQQVGPGVHAERRFWVRNGRCQSAACAAVQQRFRGVAVVKNAVQDLSQLIKRGSGVGINQVIEGLGHQPHREDGSLLTALIAPVAVPMVPDRKSVV